VVRVALVDDKAIRVGLRMMLSGEDDIEAVGEASAGDEASALVARTRPAVVLMDIRAGGPRLDFSPGPCREPARRSDPGMQAPPGRRRSRGRTP
jgi:DNA-binding NarL/FixJ family response regulator